MMFIFENPNEKPLYLEESWFTDWADEFNQILGDISLPSLAFDGVRIEFSNATTTEKFGALTIDAVKKLIRKTWNVNEEVEDTLRTIRDYHYYRTQMRKVLAEEIHKCNPGIDHQTIKKALDGWFSNVKFTDKILGRYFPAEKKIVLYTKTIERGRRKITPFAERFSDRPLFMNYSMHITICLSPAMAS